MLGLLTPKKDNEWMASDRRERRKAVMAVLLLLAAVAGGLGLLIFALTRS
jgi:hypothetical protein